MLSRRLSEALRLVPAYPYGLAFVAVLVQAASLLRAAVAYGRPRLNLDAAFLQHAGWYVTTGAAPYRDVWMVNPPLVVETTAFFSLVAEGDPLRLHVVAVTVTVGLFVGTVLLVAAIVRSATGSDRAAVVAGLVVFVLPGFHLTPMYGFRPKFYALFFGLASLYLTDRRPAVAGVAAAAATLYWQFAGVFAVIAVARRVVARDWWDTVAVVGGGVVTTSVVLAPLVAWGVLPQALYQTVVVPLSISVSAPLVRQFGRGVLIFGVGSAAVGTGIVAVWWYAVRRDRHLWWLAAAAAAFVVQVAFVEFEGYPDLVFLLAVAAVGVGLLVSELSVPRRRVVTTLVVCNVVWSVAFLGGVGVVTNPQPLPGERGYGSPLAAEEMPLSYTLGDRLVGLPEPNDGGTSGPDQFKQSRGIPSIRQLYWNAQRPDGCHYYILGKEYTYLQQTDAEVDDPCTTGVTLG